MKRLVHVSVCALWQLPVALPIWLFYLLPCLALGLLEYWYTDKHKEFFAFRVCFPRYRWARWWVYCWRGWAGHAMPYAIVLHPVAPVSVHDHEHRHVQQWRKLGVLFPLVYLGMLLIYGYRRHPLERDADRYARRFRDYAKAKFYAH